MDALWVSIGGIAGVNLRYFLGRWIGERTSPDFPYGTFLINVTGSFVIGLVLTLLTERLALDPRWRLILVVGFLGGYTTFSSFAYEAFALVDRGDWLRATVYVIGTTVLGLLACVLGVLLARAIH